MKTTKSYWDKYVTQRRAQRTIATINRQRWTSLRRTPTPRRRPE